MGSENVTVTHLLAKTVAPSSKIILATARVRVYSLHKRFVTVRVLLDQRSVSTFIYKSLTQRLRLSRINRSVFITSISEIQSVVRYATQITIIPASRDRSAYTTTAFILPSLTKYLSNQVNTAYNWKHVAGLELADRNPMSSDLNDIIIGADLFDMLVLNGVRKDSEHKPTVQNTTFGWIPSGSIASFPTESISALAHHGVVLETLDHDLRRFWEIEEVPQKTPWSPEEHQCTKSTSEPRIPVHQTNAISFDYCLKTDHLSR